MLRLLAIPFLALLLLANGSTAVAATPADGAEPGGPAIPLPATHPVDIQAGYNHTCMLTDGGDVRCWGVTNFNMQGTQAHRPIDVPIPIAGLGRDITTLGIGFPSSCVVNGAGGVQCWGDNLLGQLGDGTTTYRALPVDVVGLNTGAKSVSAGGSHTCAVTEAGGVKCWGANAHGQLGDGTTEYRLTPVDVMGLASDVQAVATGNSSTCALMTGGGVKCWGDNAVSQLGDGTKETRLTPVDVQGLPGSARAIISTMYGYCVLVGDDSATRQALCWGSSDGNSTPSDQLGLGNGVTDLSVGTVMGCAVINGGVKCWGGINELAVVGDGRSRPSFQPVSVVGMEAGVTRVTVGYAHACAIRNNQAYCWGDSDLGRIGDGSSFRRRTPQQVGGIASVTALAAGKMHTCALVSGGVKCWGDNYFGQLGSDSLIAHFTPAEVKGLTSGVTALALGDYHSCAIKDGKLFCWGANTLGQIGDGTGTLRWAPIEIGSFAGRVLAVAAGSGHTCALVEQYAGRGSVFCWGSNTFGQLGNGSREDRWTPTLVNGLDSDIIALAAGGVHTCALSKSGRVKCWGALALGWPTEAVTTPTSVAGLDKNVAAIASGSWHNCALTKSGGMKCWGDNHMGQLGNGTATLTDPIVDVLGLTGGVQGMSLGSFHSCALLNTGAVRCWGLTDSFQVGDGVAVGQRWNPVEPVGISSGFVAVSAGFSHTCAADSNNVWCWGDNRYGQLGWNPGFLAVPVFWSQPGWTYLPQLAKQ